MSLAFVDWKGPMRGYYSAWAFQNCRKKVPNGVTRSDNGIDHANHSEESDWLAQRSIPQRNMALVEFCKIKLIRLFTLNGVKHANKEDA